MFNQFKNIFSSPLSNQEDVSSRQKDSYLPKNYLLSETAEFLIKEGERLDNQGELEEALSYYHQAVEKAPYSAKAHEKLARAWQKRGDFPQAMIHFRQAIVLNNGDEKNVEAKNSLELPGNNLEQDCQNSIQITESSSGNLFSRVPHKQHSQPKRESIIQFPLVANELKTPNLKREAAQVYLQQALAYSDKQKWPEVIEACQQAVQILPDLAEAYKLGGDALQKMGQPEEAMGFYAKALAIQPDNAEVYANLGSLFARQKNWQKAEEYYQKAIIIKPNFSGAYRNLAKVWMQLGEPEKAAECQNKALSIESQGVSAEEYLGLGDRLIGEKQPERALNYYLQAVKLSPELRIGYQKVAETWEKLGKWQEAATYYRHMFKLEPEPYTQAPQVWNGQTSALPPQPVPTPKLSESRKTQQLLPASPDLPSKQNTVIHNNTDRISKLDLVIAQYEQKAQQLTNSAPIQANLGSLYAQKQEWHKAVICYQKAIQSDPNMAGVYRNLAKVWGKLGKEADAAKCWYQAVNLEPQSANAQQHYHLGDLLYKQNQLEEAIVCYRRAIELEPDYDRSHFRIGEILQSRGRSTEAISCWEQAIRLNNSNPTYYYRLGQLLVQEKNFERAIICYQQAIKLQPKRWEISHQLGEILSRLSRWPEAVAAYNQALAVNKKNPELYLGLGNVLAKTAELDKAIVSYQIALQIEPGYQEASVQLANILRQKELAREEMSLAQQIDYPETAIERALPRTDLEQQQPNEQKTTDVRLIAFFLPQYHPIPENDEWWGKGFTEWTNVTKAKPLFDGHYQPRLPADLGFYDLRLPEVREAQARLAKKYGIHGFCYYYYWFAGKRLLDRPIDEILQSKHPDFPFCLCWANENWSRRWDGSEDEILMAQEHSFENNKAFAESLVPFMKDERYIRVKGKPLVLIYRANVLPDIEETVKLWRDVWRENGLGEVYLCGCLSFGQKASQVIEWGFDAGVQFPPHEMGTKLINPATLGANDYEGQIYDFRPVVENSLRSQFPSEKEFLSVITSWDNTARRGKKGYMFLNTNPEIYELWLRGVIEKTKQIYAGDEQLVFINAWNEWAEGTYLEPDTKYGHGYLSATYRALNEAYSLQTSINLIRYLPIQTKEHLTHLINELQLRIELLQRSIELLIKKVNEEKIAYSLLVNNIQYINQDKHPIYFDSPAPNTKVKSGEYLSFSGWCFNSFGEKIKSIKICRDKNIVLVDIPVDKNRPDIGQVYPQCKQLDVGFTSSIKMEDLLASQQNYTLEVYSVLENDEVLESGLIELTINKQKILTKISGKLKTQIKWYYKQKNEVNEILGKLRQGKIPNSIEFEYLLEELEETIKLWQGMFSHFSIYS